VTDLRATERRAEDLPIGTVTFLFTDIEGSTRLTQSLGESWPPLLESHNRILRAAVAGNGGAVFGTEGDAIFAAFASAPRAAAAAVEAQRALAAEPWPVGATIRVRMGLHTGEGQRAGDTYVGLDVHRVARITAAGHGGQVLLSGTTRMLVDGALPDGTSLRELGEHRLRDLSRPELLSMLVIEGLPSSFPPLKTLDVVPNNLPTQLTSFLGRERELAEASVLLRDARLLTLTGPGGTGKTRLSLQLAAEATDAFQDGVYFVPLGPISEPGLVLPTMAQALGLPDPRGRALEHLTEQLRDKRVLFVLDNFEQVLDAAPAIGELLQGLPGVTVLATSRSPLRVYGEREFPVPPLAVPDPRHLPELDAFSQFASVALFIERAMAVQPGFVVDAANAPAIAEICSRLDGLPLAIELAAARVRVLSPQAIMARLDHRLSLLAGGSRNLPERQQTLRGAIDWSHELLEAADRTAFARFSVFAGGADEEAFAAVVLAEWPDAAGPSPDALDALASLLDKSLIRQEMRSDDRSRYRMLETIREYASERLAEMEPASETRLRHAEYFLALAEGVAARIFSEDQRSCLDTLEAEHDNLRAAIAFAVEQDRADLAMRLLASSWRFWQMRGYLPEGRDRAERILAMPDATEHPEARLRALDAAGGIVYWQGDMEASRSHYQEQGRVARELGDRRAQAEATYNQSMTYALESDANEAERLAAEALAMYRDLGDRAGVGRAQWAYLNALAYRNDVSEGRPLAEDTVTIFREEGDRFMLAWALYTQALMLTQARELESARASLTEALEIFQETHDLSGYALVLDGFASIEWLAGNRDLAMRIAGAAAAIQDVSGVGLAARNREYAQFFPAELLEEAPLAEAYAEGQNLSLEEAVELVRNR
jgi:predicted ATPase/class 3 adenylate cyclase